MDSIQLKTEFWVWYNFSHMENIYPDCSLLMAVWNSEDVCSGNGLTLHMRHAIIWNNVDQIAWHLVVYR